MTKFSEKFIIPIGFQLVSKPRSFLLPSSTYSFRQGIHSPLPSSGYRNYNSFLTTGRSKAVFRRFYPSFSSQFRGLSRIMSNISFPNWNTNLLGNALRGFNSAGHKASWLLSKVFVLCPQTWRPCLRSWCAWKRLYSVSRPPLWSGSPLGPFSKHE